MRRGTGLRGMTNEALSRLASIAIGEGPEAAIWCDQDGTVRWSTGGAVAGAQGSDPFLAWAPNGTLACGHVPVGACEVEIRAPVRPARVGCRGRRVRRAVTSPSRHAQCVCRVPRRQWRDRPSATGRRGGSRPSSVHRHRHRLSRMRGVRLGSDQIRARPDKGFTREEIVVCRVCGRQEGGRRSAGRRRTDPNAQLDRTLIRQGYRRTRSRPRSLRPPRSTCTHSIRRSAAAASPDGSARP